MLRLRRDGPQPRANPTGRCVPRPKKPSEAAFSRCGATRSVLLSLLGALLFGLCHACLWSSTGGTRSCRPCGETSGTSVGTEVEVLMGEPYAEVSGELLSKSEPLTLRFGFTAGGSTRAPSGACPEYAAMMCCFRGLRAVMVVSSAPGGEVSAHAVPFGATLSRDPPLSCGGGPARLGDRSIRDRGAGPGPRLVLS